jgi:hypothetical protein
MLDECDEQGPFIESTIEDRLAQLISILDECDCLVQRRLQVMSTRREAQGAVYHGSAGEVDLDTG